MWKSTSVLDARQFFTKSFLGDDAAILARSSGEEPASPRHRAGAAQPMAWRTTRVASSNENPRTGILISTQADGVAFSVARAYEPAPLAKMFGIKEVVTTFALQPDGTVASCFVVSFFGGSPNEHDEKPAPLRREAPRSRRTT